LFRHRKEKRPTDQDEDCIAPLDSKGRGGDLVSNSEGYVPTTAAEADKAVATLNQDFTTKQTATAVLEAFVNQHAAR
jgi:hypothetical protein